MSDYTEIAQFCVQNAIPCQKNESLKEHVTFKIGGLASLFCTPQNEAQLIALLQYCREKAAKVYLLGRGSNILFADEGFDGVVVHLCAPETSIVCDGTHITAPAGASLAQVCLAAKEHALTGLEFAYGIPGSVGGAVYMNAGAYGGEIKNVLEGVRYVDENGIICHASADELQLGYRTSIFEKREWCILSAIFALKPGDKAQIDATMADLMQRRADKQPLDKPSAGSTFKRPKGAFAAMLIDECGLRGYRVGGAGISTKHCGFVVNENNATCADVLQLADDVCQIVKEKTGYTLEKEVRVVK